jgi:hypothetical protein
LTSAKIQSSTWKSSNTSDRKRKMMMRKRIKKRSGIVDNVVAKFKIASLPSVVAKEEAGTRMEEENHLERCFKGLSQNW